MKKRTVIAVLLLCFAANTGNAQEVTDPCALGFKFMVTKAELLGTVPARDQIAWDAIGRAMNDCDSMALLSDTTYKSLIIERHFYQSLNDQLKGLVSELEDGRSIRDSLSAVQKSFIDYQQGVITRYDTLLVRSNTLVVQANKNTERALDRLKLLRLTSIGGIALGIGGLLFALAVN